MPSSRFDEEFLLDRFEPEDFGLCSNATEILEDLGMSPNFCHACGCSDDHGCPGGCVWATPTLCSRCV